MRSRWTTTLGSVLVTASFFVLVPTSRSSAAPPPERGRPRSWTVKKADLRHIAKLGSPVRGSDGFFAVTYYYTDEKGKRKSKKAFVKIDDKVSVYVDRQSRIEDLEPGKTAHVFGRVVEREVHDRDGGKGGGGLSGSHRGKDRQIQNARVILSGDELETNPAFKDPKDKAVKWVQATVSMSNVGLWVKREGEEYRVTLLRRAPILRRTKASASERKLLKSGRYVHLIAKKTDERPQTKSNLDAKKPSFEAKRVVVLQTPYLKTVYPMLFK